MKNQEYYFCYIGPTDGKKLDKKFPNGEGFLRDTIREAFKKVTGHYDEICGSGWGVTEEQLSHLSFSAHGDELKEMIVNSYISEKKQMPRHVRAWYLLLEEERNKTKKI